MRVRTRNEEGRTPTVVRDLSRPALGGMRRSRFRKRQQQQSTLRTRNNSDDDDDVDDADNETTKRFNLQTGPTAEY